MSLVAFGPPLHSIGASASTPICFWMPPVSCDDHIARCSSSVAAPRRGYPRKRPRRRLLRTGRQRGNVEGGSALVRNAAQPCDKECRYDAQLPARTQGSRDGDHYSMPWSPRRVLYLRQRGRRNRAHGPDDWPLIGLLKRQGKISFTSQLVRERFEAASQSAMMKGCYPMLQGALRRGPRFH